MLFKDRLGYPEVVSFIKSKMENYRTDNLHSISINESVVKPFKGGCYHPYNTNRIHHKYYITASVRPDNNFPLLSKLPYKKKNKNGKYNYRLFSMDICCNNY